MDSNSKTPSSECTGTDAPLANGNSTVFSASTTGPFAADSNMYRINHQFDDMDFDKVQVEGSNLEVCTEAADEERQQAILMLCTGMRRTVDGFNLSALSSFPTSVTVVFLRFATGNANEDVYEGSYSLTPSASPGAPTVVNNVSHDTTSVLTPLRR